MPAEIRNASTHPFYSQDEILFDANIWLYLEGLPGQPQHWVDAYSALLERILVRRCVLVTAPLVLSEFINRYLAIEYGAWAHHRSKSRKEFRSSAAFGPALASLDHACRNILNQCGRTTRKGITLAELRADAETFGNGGHDFNDLVLARLCRHDNLILVTNDADLAAIDGLTIVTANQRLFR